MPISRYQWPEVSDDIEAAVLAQLRRTVSIYDNSDVFGVFENEFRSLHNRRFGLVTNSGTTALASIYWSLDLPEGATVVVPAYTFFATFTPLLYRSVRVILCDCDEFGNISSDTLGDVLDDSVKAVVVTHMWGIPADVVKIKAMCDRVGAILIEDCSHSHGATRDGYIVGSKGYAAAWSLQGGKTVTGGEGGILCTDDESLYHKALLFGHYNRRCTQEIPLGAALSRYSKTGFGLKFRAHPLAIAHALVLLRRLDSILDARNPTAKLFASALRSNAPTLVHAFETPGRKSWYAFPIVATSNERAVAVMRLATERGAQDFDLPGSTGDVSEYPLLRELPLRQYGLIASIDWTRSRFANARCLSKRLVKLPVWTHEQQHASVINAYVDILLEVTRGG